MLSDRSSHSKDYTDKKLLQRTLAQLARAREYLNPRRAWRARAETDASTNEFGSDRLNARLEVD